MDAGRYELAFILSGMGLAIIGLGTALAGPYLKR